MEYAAERRPQGDESAVRVHRVSGKLRDIDLGDLCEATEQSILDDRNGFSIGFIRSAPLARQRLEQYWKGVLLAPERELIVGRVDGVIAGALHFVRPSPINQTSSFAAVVENHFVVPWARGLGLARELLNFCEREARSVGLGVLRLSVRSDMEEANELYRMQGFVRWGTLDIYERIGGKLIPGHFYYKIIDHSLL